MQRTLSVTCSGGLANRLRVLASGLAAAEATDRRFEMVWPTERHTCGAGFHQLFDSNLPVRDVDRLDDPGSWTMADGHFSPPPDVLLSPEPDLRLSYVGWLVDREKSADHARVADRAEQIIAELQLLPQLQYRVAEVAATFGSSVVGVHVRRGDFIAARPDVVANLDQVLVAAQARVDAGADTVFLATDDGAPPVAAVPSAAASPAAVPSAAAPPAARGESELGVRDAFRASFGERLVETRPRTLDRSSLEAIEDSAVDLWLLRRCDEIVGTAASSFSEVAVVGRGAPITYCSGRARPYRRLDRLIEDVRLDGVITRWGRRRYGIDVPTVAITRRLVTAPKRLAQRVVRRG